MKWGHSDRFREASLRAPEKQETRAAHQTAPFSCSNRRRRVSVRVVLLVRGCGGGGGGGASRSLPASFFRSMPAQQVIINKRLMDGRTGELNDEDSKTWARKRRLRRSKRRDFKPESFFLPLPLGRNGMECHLQSPTKEGSKFIVMSWMNALRLGSVGCPCLARYTLVGLATEQQQQRSVAMPVPPRR